MELGYIVRAVREYWWLTATIVALVVVGTAYTVRDDSVTYQATALLQLGDNSALTTDRQIASQMVLLGSGAVLNEASNQLEGALTPGEVGDATQFTQITGTEIVSVTGTAASGEQAAAVANALVTAYVAVESDRQAEAARRETEPLEAQIASLQTQLDQVDADIKQALAQYLPDIGDNSDTGEVPSIEQVNPDLASRRQVVLDQYTNAVRARDEVARQLSSGFVGEMLDDAEAPTIATVTTNTLVLAAGLIAGIVFGVAAAVIVARLSPRVLDVEEASEILGVPFVGELAVARGRTDITSTAPTSSGRRRFVRQLCVQAESLATTSDHALIVVTGATAHAATSILATAMAQRYAAQGVPTLLVHAGSDRHELLAKWREAGAVAVTPPADLGLVDMIAVSPSAGLTVAVPDAALNSDGLRRESAGSLLAKAPKSAPIVIIDGGALLASAATVEFAGAADAVVLTVHVRRLGTKALRAVSRVLNGSESRMLPVAISTAAPRRVDAKQRTSNSEATAANAEAMLNADGGATSRFTWERTYVGADSEVASEADVAPSPTPVSDKEPAASSRPRR